MSTSTNESKDPSQEEAELKCPAPNSNVIELIFHTRYELALRTAQIASNDTIHREWSEFHSRLR